MENSFVKRVEQIFYFGINLFLLVFFSLTIFYTLSFKAQRRIEDVREWLLFGEQKLVLISLLIIVFALGILAIITNSRFLKWTRKIEISITFIFLVLCLFASYYFANEGSSEISAVSRAAKFFSIGEAIDYDYVEFLSHYRYLSPIIFFASVCYKIGGKMFASVVVCVGMTLGLWVSMQVLKKLNSNDSSLWLCSILFYISMPIYLSCSIFYNYSVVFWVPITLLYVYLLYCNENQIGKKNSYLVLMAVIAVFGISIFSIVAVPVIAIIIDMIFNKRKDVIIFAVVVLLCGSLVSYATGKYVMNSIFNTDELQQMVYENEFPMTLSTMYVGLNSESIGYFTMEDYWYITSFKSYDEKNEALRGNIKERAISGMTKPGFILAKSSINFCQGSFYSERVSEDGLSKERPIIKYFSKNHSEVVYYLSFFCAVNIVLILLMLISIIMKNKDFNIFRLSIFGALLVTLISETDSRHVFSYLPLLIVMATITLSNIRNYLSKEFEADV